MARRSPPKAPRTCPCHSGLAYSACCAPYHEGVREAPDPVALMRSRYSAFALGEAEYLWRTLSADHEDRSEPAERALRSLRASKDVRRYTSLAILDARSRGREGEVLFAAGILERGRDISFVELSDFVHDREGWRYASGVLVPFASLGRSIDGLTIDAFLAIAANAPT